MDLVQQLDHLDITLLGTVVNQFPDPLTDAERAQVHAYLVLAHAVLEEHLETIFLTYFDTLCSWLSEDLVPVECLRFTYAVTQQIQPGSVAYRKRDTIKTLLALGRAEFEKRLTQNNGLKTQNVESMASLVGFDWPTFEAAFNIELADLDTLGVKRGAAGHLSPYTSRVNAIAASDGPEQIREWVNNARVAVEAIARYLAALCPAPSASTGSPRPAKSRSVSLAMHGGSRGRLASAKRRKGRISVRRRQI